MELHSTTRQHPEIGSVAIRMLWIPVVASILVGGYFVLRTPQDDGAPAMATARAAAPVTHTATPTDTTAPRLEATTAKSAETAAEHETLDPVGAGHDVAR